MSIPAPIRARVRVDVPRKGNVDRNLSSTASATKSFLTFPARGTWIEMPLLRRTHDRKGTFPGRGTRKEILLGAVGVSIAPRRSPQGERG